MTRETLDLLTRIVHLKHQGGIMVRRNPRSELAVHSEQMESRLLLTAFAEFQGQILDPGTPAQVALEIGLDQFTPGKKGQILLNIEASPGPGSLLNPGSLQFAGGQVQSSDPNLGQGLGSGAVVRASAGNLGISLLAEAQSTGAFQLQISLAGDVNGDFQVDKVDIQAIKRLFGLTPQSPQFLVSADLNFDGVITKSDLKLAKLNLKATTDLRFQAVEENPLDEFLSDGALNLIGLDEQGFNPLSAPVQIQLTGAEFFQDLNELELSINGASVLSGDITLTSTLVSASGVLVDGRNDISLAAVDAIGRPLHFTATVWAGSNTLNVSCVDSEGVLITDPVMVVATLGDDPSVLFQTTVTDGLVTIPNVPIRTILIQGSTSENRVGIAGAVGNAGNVTLTLLGFNAPSLIDNNDLSLGVDGWDIGSSPVSIVPHQESIPDVVASSTGFSGTSFAIAAAETDNDLVVSTSDEGEETASRTFETMEGTTSVRVRYRFVTSEVPGGYFGTEFNDYYRVSIRSQMGGGFQSDANNMNNLGLGAFDFASGSTQWRELTLDVNPAGDTIQVDATVANVADGLFDSQVIIDFIEEEKQQVTPHLVWNNTQGGLDLTYEVEGEDLTEDVPINVFWANGTQYGNRIGAAIFTFTVPSGTTAGSYGPIHIDGSLLLSEATGTTHLLAASSEDDFFALQDVTIGFGPQANAAAVSAGTLKTVRGLLRFAGQSSATITSTARTPEDQARAMFQNLVHAGETAAQIANNIDIQKNGDGAGFLGYAAAGDAVIDVFAGLTAGQDATAVLANQTAIREAMEQEINKDSTNPSKVSRHCADSSVTNVFDISAGAFSTSSANLFVQQVQASGITYIDERSSNGCFHLEIAQ